MDIVRYAEEDEAHHQLKQKLLRKTSQQSASSSSTLNFASKPDKKEETEKKNEAGEDDVSVAISISASASSTSTLGNRSFKRLSLAEISSYEEDENVISELDVMLSLHAGAKIHIKTGSVTDDIKQGDFQTKSKSIALSREETSKHDHERSFESIIENTLSKPVSTDGSNDNINRERITGRRRRKGIPNRPTLKGRNQERSRSTNFENLAKILEDEEPLVFASSNTSPKKKSKNKNKNSIIKPGHIQGQKRRENIIEARTRWSNSDDDDIEEPLLLSTQLAAFASQSKSKKSRKRPRLKRPSWNEIEELVEPEIKSSIRSRIKKKEMKASIDPIEVSSNVQVKQKKIDDTIEDVVSDDDNIVSWNSSNNYRLASDWVKDAAATETPRKEHKTMSEFNTFGSSAKRRRKSKKPTNVIELLLQQSEKKSETRLRELEHWDVTAQRHDGDGNGLGSLAAGEDPWSQLHFCVYVKNASQEAHLYKLETYVTEVRELQSGENEHTSSIIPESRLIILLKNPSCDAHDTKKNTVNQTAQHKLLHRLGHLDGIVSASDFSGTELKIFWPWFQLSNGTLIPLSLVMVNKTNVEQPQFVVP